MVVSELLILHNIQGVNGEPVRPSLGTLAAGDREFLVPACP